MIVHRCIGAQELLDLINNKEIVGKELDDSGNLVVSLFKDGFWINDSKHTYDIYLDIPEHRLTLKDKVYKTTKETVKTGIFDGRTGDVECVVKEAYVKSYSILDVKLIKTSTRPIKSLLLDIVDELSSAVSKNK